MRYQVYTLKKAVNKKDDYGQIIPTWEDVKRIEVAVSNKMFSNVEGDIVYRHCEITGVTPYKGFEVGYKYKLSSSVKTLNIETFNTGGRLTQLILKECVEYE